MKEIAFYISGRKESVMRCQVIIDTLLRLEEELNIYVVSEEWAVDWLKSQFANREERVRYYIEETDIPICLKEGTKQPDWKETEKRAEEFIAGWDDYTERAEDFLLEHKIGLVISDLCPWVFGAADNLRIKSLLISDFTWDQVYKGHLSEAVWKTYESCYEDAGKILAYDVHQPELEQMVEDYEPVSLISGAYDMERIEQIRWGAGRPIVYLGSDVPVAENFSELPYYFIREENSMLSMHNDIAASDYVIGTGRWDEAAFALLANKKAAYYKEEGFPVEAKRIDIIKERGQCIEIAREELNDIARVLEKLDALDYNYDMGYHIDDYEIAKMILNAYPKKRKRREEK